MRAGLERLCELRQEDLHAGGGGLGQGKGKSVVRAGPAGGKQIEAVEALVGEPRRAHPALVPAVADPALLPDPGLILAPKLDLPVRMRLGGRV